MAPQAWAQSRVRLKTRAADSRPVRKPPRPEHATHFLLEFPTEPGAELVSKGDGYVLQTIFSPLSYLVTLAGGLGALIGAGSMTLHR